jgi:hypothetical protein
MEINNNFYLLENKPSNKYRITLSNILNESKNHIIDNIEDNEEFFIIYFDIPQNNNEYSSTKYYTKNEDIDNNKIIYIDNLIYNKKSSSIFSKKPVDIFNKLILFFNKLIIMKK